MASRSDSHLIPNVAQAGCRPPGRSASLCAGLALALTALGCADQTAYEDHRHGDSQSYDRLHTAFAAASNQPYEGLSLIGAGSPELVAIGDSILDGFNAEFDPLRDLPAFLLAPDQPIPNFGSQPELSWATGDKVEGNLKTLMGFKTSINLARPGATIDVGLGKQVDELKDVDLSQTKLILVQLGGNDICTQPNVGSELTLAYEKKGEALRKAVRMLADKAPHATIALVGPPSVKRLIPLIEPQIKAVAKVGSPGTELEFAL